MHESLLTYDHVDIAYNGAVVVRDACFAVGAGEVLGIVGESGSGKSILMKAAMGLLGPDGMVTRGDIRYAGSEASGGPGRDCAEVSLVDLSPRQLRALYGSELGMVFQDCRASLTPIKRIGDQVYEAMAAHCAVSRSESDERMRTLLRRLNFTDPDYVLGKYPFELSGGMGQRVGLAMALLLQPRVLLADEPTSALDTISQRQVIDELRRLRDIRGMAIVIVTHNIGVVRVLADRIVVLEGGIVREQGSAAAVLSHPKSAYTRSLLAAAPRLRNVRA